MENKFISSLERVLIYERKPDTANSYYRVYGCDWFPLRINFKAGSGGFNPIRNTGRALHFKRTGELKAEFTRKDFSPYKLTPKDARISFSLWEAVGYPFIYGFAEVGRTNEKQKIEETNDLVILLRSDDNCRDRLVFHLYPGLYNKREEVFHYLRKHLKQPA